MKKWNAWVLVLALGAAVVGCGGDDESGATAETPSVGAAPSTPAEPEEPEGPVFRTTMMGMEMTEPLVTRDLEAAGLPGLTIVAPERAELMERYNTRVVGSELPSIDWAILAARVRADEGAAAAGSGR